MSVGQSVTRHPDLEEIIALFNDGTSVRAVEAILRQKYGAGHKFALSYMTLQGFRINYMEIDRVKTMELRKAAKNKIYKDKDLEAKSKVATSLTYLEKKQELAENDIDVLDEQVRLLSMLEDQLSQANALGNSLSDNNQRIRMFEAMSRLLAENRQFLDSVHRRQSESKSPINIQNAQINITQVNNYMDSIKEAVVETFRTTHPDLLPQFLMSLSNKLSNYEIVEAEVIKDVK